MRPELLKILDIYRPGDEIEFTGVFSKKLYVGVVATKDELTTLTGLRELPEGAYYHLVRMEKEHCPDKGIFYSLLLPGHVYAYAYAYVSKDTLKAPNL